MQTTTFMMPGKYPWVGLLLLTLLQHEPSMAEANDSAPVNTPIANECIRFGNPKHTDGISKYEIYEPGRYCLTEDLHARFAMADHPAEGALIIVRASNVVLDLQGHTLGRGWLFKNPGGVGVEIVAPYKGAGRVGELKNIVIKNGRLQDFNTGILAGRWDDTIPDTPSFDPQTNCYRFPFNNITLENIVFKNNKRDFDISAPGPKK